MLSPRVVRQLDKMAVVDTSQLQFSILFYSVLGPTESVVLVKSFLATQYIFEKPSVFLS